MNYQEQARWVMAISTWLFSMFILYRSCYIMVRIRKLCTDWRCGNVEHYRACTWVEASATISLMFVIAQLDLFRQMYTQDPDTYTLFFWMWQLVDIGFFLLIKRALGFVDKVASKSCPYVPTATPTK